MAPSIASVLKNLASERATRLRNLNGSRSLSCDRRLHHFPVITLGAEERLIGALHVLSNANGCVCRRGDAHAHRNAFPTSIEGLLGHDIRMIELYALRKLRLN